MFAALFGGGKKEKKARRQQRQGPAAEVANGAGNIVTARSVTKEQRGANTTLTRGIPTPERNNEPRGADTRARGAAVRVYTIGLNTLHKKELVSDPPFSSFLGKEDKHVITLTLNVSPALLHNI